ncbi:unnamed protein product [Parnassius apollo]|uniref:(apollo) hypothetical protein n=1 Tax=Parnassius apollo TaxID=110799 RepID=A0A8S3WGC1_PARAO|nr:unnamed protein product [Parnassius apollo]
MLIQNVYRRRQIIITQHILGSDCEDVKDLIEEIIDIAEEEVIVDGDTEVKISEPITDNLTFEGPVYATGTIKIVGMSWPMFPIFGRRPFMSTRMIFPTYYYNPFSYFVNPYDIIYDNDDTLSYDKKEEEEIDNEKVFIEEETADDNLTSEINNDFFSSRIPVSGRLNIFARF